MAFFLSEERLVSARELAEFLHISRNELYRHWRAWELPGLFVGGQLRFDLDEVEEWLESRKAAERRVGGRA